MEEHEAIVREVAEKPWLERHHSLAADGDLLYTCGFCDVEPQSFEALHVAVNHEPDCTWRRAEALSPNPARQQTWREAEERRRPRRSGVDFGSG